jgi:hypothetical protein
MDIEETPAAVEEQGGSQPEPTVEPEAAVVDDSTAAPAEGQEQADQFDWSKYQNADRYKGRTVQDLINYANQRDYQYGQQSNELGEARKYKSEFEALRAQIAGQKPTEVKPKFSEVEQAMFLQKLQENPMSAINEFLEPKLAESLKAKIYEDFKKDIGPTIRGHAQDVADQQERAKLFEDHPELNTDDKLLWMTRRMMGPDYVGQQVPYEEAYLLAKMAIGNASLFPTTCYLMRSGLKFKEAKEYASLKKNAAATAKTAKDQIKEEVNSIAAGTKSTAKKSGAKEPVIKDFDEAFE